MVGAELVELGRRGCSLKSSAGRGGRSRRRRAGGRRARWAGRRSGPPASDAPSPGQLGTGQVGATLGHPPHVGHGVVEGLQLAPAGLQLVEVEASLTSRSLIAAPPDTGGSTAISSLGPTVVVSAAGSPLTQIRHVSSTSANAARSAGGRRSARRRPSCRARRHAPSRRPRGPTRTCARSPRRRAYPGAHRSPSADVSDRQTPADAVHRAPHRRRSPAMTRR